ncbi:P-loop containing nucleoside triphosphate hydrolase protein [Russula brevipes]|nr:P-loop containing nucleoside triphosphate hydrolase protein [Russula brevipes]
MPPTLLPPKNIAFLISATIVWLTSTTSPPQPAPEPIKVKLVVAGNWAVGKSSLLLQFCQREWFPGHRPGPNIGVDFRVHRTEVDGRRIKVQLWDTAGQERFGTMPAPYYRGVQGIILVYDVSSRKSFQALPHWLEQIENHAPPGAVKLLVGNKLEKEDSREVPTKEGAEFAARNGCLFAEVSAKTGEGVSEAINDVIARIVHLISPAHGEKQPEPPRRDGVVTSPGSDGPPHASSSEKLDLTSIRRGQGSSSRCWS